MCAVHVKNTCSVPNRRSIEVQKSVHCTYLQSAAANIAARRPESSQSQKDLPVESSCSQDSEICYDQIHSLNCVVYCGIIRAVFYFWPCADKRSCLHQHRETEHEKIARKGPPDGAIDCLRDKKTDPFLWLAWPGMMYAAKYILNILWGGRHPIQPHFAFGAPRRNLKNRARVRGSGTNDMLCPIPPRFAACTSRQAAQVQ